MIWPETALLLSIETTLSAPSCSLSQCSGETVTTISHQKGTLSATTELIPLIQNLFKESQIPFDQIHAVSVSRGPGSLTQIRAGLATAQGISLAQKCPILAVPTFDLLESVLEKSQKIYGVLDTYGSYLLLKSFQDDMIEKAGTPEELSCQLSDNALLAGPGANRLKPFVQGSQIYNLDIPNWSIILGQTSWKRRFDPLIKDSCPLYGVKPSITFP